MNTTIATSTSQGANVAPDTASGSTAITPVADVTTTVTAPASAAAGTTVSVPISFSNAGPSTADGVTYAITLPVGLSGVTCSAGATCTYDSGSGVVTVSGLPTSLASGASAPV